MGVEVVVLIGITSVVADEVKVIEFSPAVVVDAELIAGAEAVNKVKGMVVAVTVIVGEVVVVRVSVVPCSSSRDSISSY